MAVFARQIRETAASERSGNAKPQGMGVAMENLDEDIDAVAAGDAATCNSSTGQADAADWGSGAGKPGARSFIHKQS